ncbi:MAG: 30S ribosomal protein S8e [archaeon]
MTLWQEKSFRRASGGIRNSRNRASKYLHQKGGEFAETTLNETREAKRVNGLGSTHKTKLRKADTANVTDATTQKTQKMKIIWVHENAANRLYVRRNIITKGTLIEVEKDGKKAFARVTNRPGQAGAVSAILAEKPAEKEKKAKPAAKNTKKPAKKAKAE